MLKMQNDGSGIVPGIIEQWKACMTKLAGQYFLNGELTEETIRAHIREFAKAGYDEIYFETRSGLKTPYFSQSWWDIIRAGVDECSKCGITPAIWDEDTYPSGTAGNRIVWEHPELAAKELCFTVLDAEAGKSIASDFETFGILLRCYFVSGNEISDITRFCGTRRTIWCSATLNQSAYSPSCKIPAPHWRRWMRDIRFSLSFTPEKDGRIVAVQVINQPEARHNTDLMNPETTRLLVSITHEEYFKRFGPVFTSTFLDEPAPSGEFPWTGKFDSEFQRDHGFSLLEKLPHLTLEIDEETPRIRHAYRMTQHRLLCENYLRPIKDWCHVHGVRSVGHLSRSEYMSYLPRVWPDELRCFKELDIPCCDPLGAVTAFPDASAYHTGVKAVSSAAWLFGKEAAGSDALAVSGDETALRDLHFQLDYQLVLGITYFNIHGLCYSTAGNRKDEAPPSLFLQHSEWPLMSELLRDLKVRCARLSAGKTVWNTAVLYPVAEFNVSDETRRVELEESMHALSEKLLSRQIDFLLIDEITFAERMTADPEFFVREFPYFMMPPDLKVFDPATAPALSRYQAAGGRLAAEPEESMRAPLTGEGTENIFIARRQLPDGRIDAFLFNRSSSPFHGHLAGKAVYVPASGGAFADDSVPREAAETVASPGVWNVRFDDNTAPLTLFNTDDHRVVCLKRRESVPSGGTFSFLASGEFKKLQLHLDPETVLGGSWQTSLNGQRIPLVREGEKWSGDLIPALQTGSVPRINLLRFELAENAVLNEMPVLSGRFSAEFRHGASGGLPYLSAHDCDFAGMPLSDWSSFGFGNYSGKAEYTAEIVIPSTGTYRIDPGRVEDAAVIAIGNQREVRAWSPYGAEFELEAGRHILKVTVYNASGNRDRDSHRPAGLLGPVEVRRIV